MFVQSGHNPNRFSLLLLEEGEYYFEDFEAVYYPTCENDQISFQKYILYKFNILKKKIKIINPTTNYFSFQKTTTGKNKNLFKIFFFCTRKWKISNYSIPTR